MKNTATMRPLILALMACSAGTSHAVSFTQNDVTLDINGTINGFYVVREAKSINKATGASTTTTISALTNGLLPGWINFVATTQAKGQDRQSQQRNRSAFFLACAAYDAVFGVYEMGAGKPGDIAYLCDVVTPQVALVNNIAAAHLERMGSMLGIAQTKGAIYRALPMGGVAVIAADEPFAPLFEEMASHARIVRFGVDCPGDVMARQIHLGATSSRFLQVTHRGSAQIHLPLAGMHNVRNALAAAAMALPVDVALTDIVAGLEQATAVDGRLQRHELNGDIVLIDQLQRQPGIDGTSHEIGKAMDSGF